MIFSFFRKCQYKYRSRWILLIKECTGNYTDSAWWISLGYDKTLTWEMPDFDLQQ
uniref:Uncharacterized protein n=1 Tax=Octopus bimaculoides TaxID=37653 RepID=A0A0L8I8S9_OCTBM